MVGHEQSFASPDKTSSKLKLTETVPQTETRFTHNHLFALALPQRTAPISDLGRITFIILNVARSACKDLIVFQFKKFFKAQNKYGFYQVENFCLVLDSKKGIFSPPDSQTAMSNCSYIFSKTGKRIKNSKF